jgi:hypothetical protein
MMATETKLALSVIKKYILAAWPLCIFIRKSRQRSPLKILQQHCNTYPPATALFTVHCRRNFN